MAIHLITVSALILAVLLVRAVFRKKVPARLIYALWLVVAVKLCMPFSLFALELPSTAEVPQTEQTATQTQDAPVVSKAPEVLTPITPIASQQPIVSQQIGTKPSEPMVPTVPVTPITPVESSATAPAAIESIETEVAIPEAPTVVETTPIDWAHIAKVVWFVGLVIMAVWFAVSGTVFHQRLCADRRLHTTVGRTKVYVSKSAGAPCLAGLIPAIYLTPAAVDSPSEHFVITHEYTHLRHGDHVWAVLRTVALIVYWWNPLVWAAAMVSKQDAELACDEAVAAKLDDSQRLAYAHTILDTIPQKHAHAVGLGSAPIKERILMLTKRHKNRVVAAILAVALTLCAVGCSFIGPKETTEPVEDTDLPSSIATAQTTAAEEENTPAVAENLVRVHSNEGNLLIGSIQIPTEPFEYQLWQYDASHYLCLTYDQIELEGYKEYAYLDLHLYVIDAKAGTIAADCTIDGSYNLHSIHYTDKGCILYGWMDTAFHVVYENGTLWVETTERPTYPVVNDCPIVSADGAYTIYTTAENVTGAGTMTVRYADGSVKALLRHKNAGSIVDGEPVGIGDVERYHPIGFVDDTRFVYSITGWEYSKGYGVYDLQTGENTKYLQALSVCGVYDGKVYLTQNVDYETVAWWMCDPDGSNKTIIASVKPENAVFTLSDGMYNYTYGFAGGVWFFHYAGNTTLYAHDFTETLAVITYSHKGSNQDNLLICENSVTVVVPVVSVIPKEDVSITTLADWQQINYDGAFPADGNCYALINGLVHFGGKPDLADKYPELAAVTIGNYTIYRSEDGALLHFDFTVTESGLDTLPIGNYKTTVNPVFANGSGDAYMQILESDAKDRITGIQTDSESAEMLHLWLYSELAWDCYPYGVYNDHIPADYIARRYGENGMIEMDAFLNVMSDVFGDRSITEEEVRQKAQVDVIDGKTYVCGGERGGLVVYDIVGLEEGRSAAQDILTVQYYHDINRLIKSHKVTYTIEDAERFHGCEIVQASAYEPFGAEALFMYRYRTAIVDDVTIRSLADWKELNYDGQFSDAGNCYALINGLVHFGGGADLSERYPEFQTVTIGEYAISRKKDEKFLYFDFTVTASGLDTLPVGNYKTTVALFAGPQSDDAEMEILECDAKGRLQSVTTDRASKRYLSTWFLAELAWDMGDYGTYDTSASDGFPDNYLAHCEGGRYSLAELNALVKDTFGVEIAADSWFAHDTDDNGDIVLTPGFGGFAFFYDIVDLQIGEDADLITVQHYTDINKLIKSVKVAYRVSNTGRVYGCELIEDAKYAPFGALYARYKYKGWEPMQ